MNEGHRKEEGVTHLSRKMFEQGFGRRIGVLQAVHTDRESLQGRKKAAREQVRRLQEPLHFEKKPQLAVAEPVLWGIRGE